MALYQLRFLVALFNRCLLMLSSTQIIILPSCHRFRSLLSSYIHTRLLIETVRIPFEPRSDLKIRILTEETHPPRTILPSQDGISIPARSHEGLAGCSCCLGAHRQLHSPVPACWRTGVVATPYQDAAIDQLADPPLPRKPLDSR